MKKYSTRFNFIINEKEAQKVGEYLETHLSPTATPHDIVALARPETSLIHKYFEWDDSKAAEQYRIQQARRLITCLFVEVNDTTMPIRESITLKDGKYYATQEYIADKEDLIEQVVASAMRELRYWKLKYERYENHFGDIIRAINKAEKNMEKRNEKTKGIRRKVYPNTAYRKESGASNYCR